MNLMGPLINPAESAYQLIGVFDGKYCLPVAQAARILGVSRVMVVNGEDGMDEISVTAPTRAVMIDEKGVTSEIRIDPTEMGIPRFRVEDLRGGSASENVEMARAILAGKGPDAVREAVLLNAGAALFVCGLAGGIAEGYRTAKQALVGGKVKDKMDQILREGVALADGSAA
jgi:anthranilate synthase/phosphoribosyltransferase